MRLGPISRRDDEDGRTAHRDGPPRSRRVCGALPPPRPGDRLVPAGPRPGQEASELTAETFARAALSLRRFRDEAGGSALPWLYGIARNLLRDYYERSRVETRARERLGMPLQHYDLGIEEAGARIDAERVAPALHAALGTLPEAQRRAVELRVLDELPYAEVGRSLGCSPLAARIKVSRALGALSRIMEGAVT